MNAIYKSLFYLSIILFFPFSYTMEKAPHAIANKKTTSKKRYPKHTSTNITGSVRNGFYALQKYYDPHVRSEYITDTQNQNLYETVLNDIQNTESLEDLKELLCQSDDLDKIFNRGKYTTLTICEHLKDTKNFSIHSISQETILLLTQLITLNQPHTIINPVIKNILEKFLSLYTKELEKEQNGIMECISYDKDLSNSPNNVA